MGRFHRFMHDAPKAFFLKNFERGFRGAAFRGDFRDEIRRGTSRGQERNGVSGASEKPNAISKTGDRVVAGEIPGRALSAPIHCVFQAARTFAESAGLGDCVEPTPDAPIGYRVSALPLDETAPSERLRAWWLLAGVCGQLRPDAVAPVTLDGPFLSWLADPDDATSCAFWAVLSTLRGSRRMTGILRAGDDLMSAEGQA